MLNPFISFDFVSLTKRNLLNNLNSTLTRSKAKNRRHEFTKIMDLISKNLIFSQCHAIDHKYKKITVEGLKVLVENGHKFPQLQAIDLTNNQITDDGLKVFTENGHKFSQLQEMNLYSNQITDAGLKALVDNGHNFPQLQTVYLWKNQITGTGLISWARKCCKINITLWFI